MADTAPLEATLATAGRDLSSIGKRFALVGGLAVSIRAEVRFTRDIDLAVIVGDDSEAETLVFSLRDRGYRPVATVEHETLKRLSTARLVSPRGVKVDLLFASSGIEREAVDRAQSVQLPSVGSIAVAAAEELLAMKVLSMTDKRLQDRIDAQRLVQCNPGMEMPRVRNNLRLITDRGFNRGQDLEAKLESVLIVEA
jgi:hypothetical protein